MSNIAVGGRDASPNLSMLLRTAANQITDFTVTWREIVDNGKVEGFTEQELVIAFKPLVRKALEGYGLSPRMINQKIYYMVHKEDIIKQQLESRKEKKSKILDSDEAVTFTDESAKAEIARLQTENNELHETITKQAFNDNPDVFCVRRDSDNYFARISIREVAGMLSGMFSDNGTKVNFAFEEVKE